MTAHGNGYGHGTPASIHIHTDNTETLVNALQRIKDLEAENKVLKSKLETAEEALAGAHRVIRETRDKDSLLPGDPGVAEFARAYPPAP